MKIDLSEEWYERAVKEAESEDCKPFNIPVLFFEPVDFGLDFEGLKEID